MSRRALLAALAAAACGDDGASECVARPGSYQVALGPGTGTCDPERASPPPELGFLIGEGEPCGRRVLVGAVADGVDCSTAGEVEADAQPDGVRDAVVRVASSCTADGSICQSSYAATVSPSP